jgi:GAF domain-containing protein
MASRLIPEVPQPSPQWSAVLDDVTGALETLSELLDGDEDFRTHLQHVCEQVVRAVPGVDQATITLVDHGVPHTVVTTDEVVAGLDHEQYRTGAGPCLEAAETGKLVRVAAVDAARRWPVFARRATDAGMNSFLSAPLIVDEQHSGAVNCYSASGSGFADLDVAVLELYTAAAEMALRAHRRYQRASELAGQLRSAMDSRAVIEQAKGILMAVHRVSADAAFGLLSEQSQRGNVKIREVAQRFVATTTEQDRSS